MRLAFPFCGGGLPLCVSECALIAHFVECAIDLFAAKAAGYFGVHRHRVTLLTRRKPLFDVIVYLSFIPGERSAAFKDGDW